jgi:hypothetical protein
MDSPEFANCTDMRMGAQVVRRSGRCAGRPSRRQRRLIGVVPAVSGEASMMVLTSDRKRIGVRSRGERAPMARRGAVASKSATPLQDRSGSRRRSFRCSAPCCNRRGSLRFCGFELFLHRQRAIRRLIPVPSYLARRMSSLMPWSTHPPVWVARGALRLGHDLPLAQSGSYSAAQRRSTAALEDRRYPKGFRAACRVRSRSRAPSGVLAPPSRASS